MIDINEFVFQVDQIVNKPISEYDVASLIKTIHSANLVAGWPNEIELAKGAVPAPFLSIDCSAELQRRKRAATAASKCFFNAVIAKEKTVEINSDSISTSTVQIFPVLGQYISMDDEERSERIQDAHDIALVSAAVATNQLVSGKFTITDAQGRYYRPNSVFVKGSPLEGLVPSLVKDVKLETVNSADLVSGIATNLIKGNLASRFYMRDTIANVVSSGVDNKANSPCDIRAVPSKKYVEDMAKRGKKALPYKYAPSAPPEPPTLTSQLTTEKLWSVLERHRSVRNADSSGISLLTNPYMFGDIGPITAGVQFSFDLFNVMSVMKKRAVQRNVSNFFTKCWPLVSENMLVVDDGAEPYDKQVVGYVNDDQRCLQHETLKISMGFSKPNVGGVSLNVVTWAKGEDLEVSVLSRLYAGRCVLSYVKSDLWSLPYTTADAENPGLRKKEPELYYRVLPSTHAHANMVWIIPEGVKMQSYSWHDHQVRTVWANQWKTYFPFHRKCFGAYDRFFPNTHHVRVTGKSRSDNYIVNDVEEIVSGMRDDTHEFDSDALRAIKYFPRAENSRAPKYAPAQEGVQEEPLSLVLIEQIPDVDVPPDEEEEEDEGIGDEIDESNLF